MKLDYFFKGNLSKEGVASAFLATVFESSHAFRKHLLSLLGIEEAPTLASRSWTVEVEMNNVDITLSTKGLSILLENKVKDSAYQEDQLLRYYTAARDRDKQSRILAVYVARQGLGKSEVKRVNDAIKTSAFPLDKAVHLSWDDLAKSWDEFAQRERPGPAEQDIAYNLKLIQVQVISSGRQQKYLREGERGEVAAIVDRALELIAKDHSIRLGRWSGRDFEEIYTQGTNATLWLDACFQADPEPPYAPVDVKIGDRFRLRLRAQVRLAGDVQRKDPLYRWWYDRVAPKNSLRVPDLGDLHRKDGSPWFKYEEKIEDSAGNVAERMAFIGRKILQAISVRMADGGFDINKR